MPSQDLPAEILTFSDNEEAVVVVDVEGVVIFMNAHPKPPAPKTTMTNAGLLLGSTPRTPKANFEDIAPPRVPDYANEKSWAALPTRQDSADLVPAGRYDPAVAVRHLRRLGDEPFGHEGVLPGCPRRLMTATAR